jgi:uncharacterized membrane protein YgcG
VVFTGLAAVLGLPVTVVAAIVAAVAAAAVATYVYWDEIKKYAGDAWEAIKGYAGDARTYIENKFKDPDSYLSKFSVAFVGHFQRMYKRVNDLAEPAAQFIRDQFNDPDSFIGRFVAGFQLAHETLWSEVQRITLEGSQAVLKFFTEGIDDLIEIAPVSWKLVTDAVEKVWEDLKVSAGSIWGAVSTTISDKIALAEPLIRGSLSLIESAFRGTFSAISSIISDAIAKLKEFLGLNASSDSPTGSGGGGGSGFSGGGGVFGAGTATSDSIPAWLSNGEYVIRAAAVSKVGMAFLNMLNSGRYSLEDIFRKLGGLKLAGGGLAVSMSRISLPSMGVPSFAVPQLLAEGGPALSGGNGSTVNLHLDGASFPLTGSADVVATLAAHMRKRASRAIGKKSFS